MNMKVFITTFIVAFLFVIVLYYIGIINTIILALFILLGLYIGLMLRRR